jgi:hypothetical protein
MNNVIHAPEGYFTVLVRETNANARANQMFIFFSLVINKHCSHLYVTHMEFYNYVPLLTLHADSIRNAVFAASDGSFLER